MPVASRNGVAFHLQELGEGPPVVMLHGLLIGSLATWYFTTAPALARRHRVLLYDLRGHGKTERAPTGYDLATMVADLTAIVDAFAGGAKITLVGHSYGAVVALCFALSNPDRVSKLVVVEAPLPPSHVEEFDGFFGRTPEAMADALPEVLRDALGRKGRQAERLLRSLAFLISESSLASDLRAAEDLDDADLRTLRPPLLCVYGTRSSCRPVGQRLARLAPNTRLVELEGGHFLPVECPGALTSAIVRFVDG